MQIRADPREKAEAPGGNPPTIKFSPLQRERKYSSMAIRNLITTLALGAALGLSPALTLAASAQAPVIPHKHLYPATTDAQHDLDAAIALAHKEHKRVLVDFGGDWCGDCQVLDIYANEQPNAELLAKYFVKVNINIGHIDTNKDIAARCGVDLRGVPALAVLSSNGKVIFGQHNEFSNMRAMQSSDLTAFLNKWKQ
jgi:thiol:disulfide interchange protein